MNPTRRLTALLFPLGTLACASEDAPAASNCTETRIPAPAPGEVIAWGPPGIYRHSTAPEERLGRHECVFRNPEKTILLCAESFTYLLADDGHFSFDSGHFHHFRLRFNRSPTLEPVGAVLPCGPTLLPTSSHEAGRARAARASGVIAAL